MFNHFDDDGSGAMDVHELSAAMDLMGITISVEECEALMSKIDKDNDGDVSFEEFHRWGLEYSHLSNSMVFR